MKPDRHMLRTLAGVRSKKPTARGTRRSRALPGLVAFAFAACGASVGPAAHARALQLDAVSSSPNYVTGDDVVVRVAGAKEGAALKFRLNGQAVMPVRAERAANGRDVDVLLAGLRPGLNELSVSDGAGQAALRVEARPVTEPLLAIPKIPLTACATEASGLGPAKDADCSAPMTVAYFYRTTAGAFKPLSDRRTKPADLAMVTLNGAVLPYVVRVESGVIQRSIYRIAVLDNPGAAEGAGWRPGSAWNGRLVIAFGGGCGMHYAQGGAKIETVLSDLELSKGFAYATSPTLVNQQFCSPLMQAETAMALKERFVKGYGAPAWTLGFGSSGGSIQQYLIAEMFPGLLDGIQPGASFPDSQLSSPTDCGLLDRVFASDPSRWPSEKRAAVTGLSSATCADWIATFSQNIRARPAPSDMTTYLGRVVTTAGGVLVPNPHPCGVADSSLLYDRTRNPKGLRCSLYDFQAGLLGRDSAGRGRRIQDNVGVQYGLGALNAGKIDFDDFVALNRGIGGYDDDGEWTPARSKADPRGVSNAYATGLLNSGGGGLALVPIITQRVYVDNAPAGGASAIHERLQDLVIRARLEAANRTAGNQVIWTQGPQAPVDFKAKSLDLATRWLDAIVADPAPRSPKTTLAHKPADAQDACWDANGTKIAERASVRPDAKCNQLFPLFQGPRMVAGEGLSNDVLVCALKPIRRADYAIKLAPAQMDALRNVFPTGVCDYSKPSPHFVAFQGPLAAR